MLCPFLVVCAQLFGTGCVAQSVLSDSAKGDFFSINWGWVSTVT